MTQVNQTAQAHQQLHTQTDTQATSVSSQSIWARIKQYQPESRLVKCLFVWWLMVVLITSVQMSNGFGMAALASLVSMTDVLLSAMVVLLLVLVVIAVIDVLLLHSLSQVQNYRIAREYPKNIAVFHELQITALLSHLPDNLNGLTRSILSALGVKHIHADFYDDYPNQFELINTQSDKPLMPLSISLPLHSEDDTPHNLTEGDITTITKKIDYPVIPTERGTGYFDACYIRIISPLGFFRRKLTLHEHPTHVTDTSRTQKNNYIRVLADFTGLMTNELSAVYERSFDAGIQTLKQQGQGSEFLKLREYAVGDSVRQIDWKASSRQNRLMSKSYEEENDQDVIILLDCSEQMRHKNHVQDVTALHARTHKELSYFDKVLNAVLLLAHVANKQNDNVGMLFFGTENHSDSTNFDKKKNFIPPRKGVSLLRHLLNQTADIKPSMQTCDYYLTAQHTLQLLKKRSLVIMITNTRQEASDELIKAVQLLSAQHQLVFANLTEDSVQSVIDHHELPMTHDDALLYHTLSGYQQQRDKLHRLLSQKTGALCLNTTADKLPLKLTEAYMTVKR